MIEITIDGKKLSVPEGTSIIEAADDAGIYIPRFCYHKKLSVAANCRMCLVEVVNGRGPIPACATPVTKDMEVKTQSKAAIESQRAVMEFLLINHPLDCPICDQGGECELQDLAMGYGSPYSHYDEAKRSVASEDIGPLIETEMTRCIHCTRCVRFGEEIAGLRELGVTFRGEKAEIGTYIQHFLKSELSGNVIDLCPVGALTNKPARYQERSWQLQEFPSIAPHDCVGSNIFVHSRGQEYVPQREVIRAVPRENDVVNENWISDRDRYSVEAVNHQDRLLTPRIKQNGHWTDIDWKQVLMSVADKLQKTLSHHGSEEFAAIVSPNSTLEECYLMQKMMRQLGSPHIDHRIREQDFSDQAELPEFPQLNMSIADLETKKAFLLVGSNLRYDQPMLNHRLLKAVDVYQAAVMRINPVNYPVNYPIQHQLIDRDIVYQLAAVAKALADQCGIDYAELNQIQPNETAQHIASTLKAAEDAVIIMGNFAVQHPEAAQCRRLVKIIAELSHSQYGCVSDGANGAGAWLAGAVPHRGPMNSDVVATGDHAKALFTSAPKKAYFLLGIEPEYDSAYPAEALRALAQADLVVCFSSYTTPQMEQYADVILPIAPFTENQGTLVNVSGLWQSFSAASVPKGEAKPAWKVLRVLANFMQMDGFEYSTLHQVRNELERALEDMPKQSLPSKSQLSPIHKINDALLRVAMPSIYRCDPIVRRSQALQATDHDDLVGLRMHDDTAKKLGVFDQQRVIVKQGGQTLTLPLVLDTRIAEGMVWLPMAAQETVGFGAAMTDIEVVREG